MTTQAENPKVLRKVRRYLKQPYCRIIRPDGLGGFWGVIPELNGVLSAGDTAEEALRNLEEVAETWLCIEVGKDHPIPMPLTI